MQHYGDQPKNYNSVEKSLHYISWSIKEINESLKQLVQIKISESSERRSKEINF